MIQQLTPVLSLVLTHDLLLSKRGVALPAKHGLHASITRHKARLASELTKARLRRGCPTLEALRSQVGGAVQSASGYVHPRWIRVNTLLTTLSEELRTTFSDFTQTNGLVELTTPSVSGSNKLLHVDEHIPDLVAVSGNRDLSASVAYKDGRLVFQEKASCFPAYLLDPASVQGDIVDACAAPGNKTTHLAALLRSATTNIANGRKRTILACEKDATRSETLRKMVKLAGAGEAVQVSGKQDFMKLDPSAPEFEGIEALLLDPSCSGSGIVGRDEAKLSIYLPSRESGKQQDRPRGKKRKRDDKAPAEIKVDTSAEADTPAEEAPPDSTETEDAGKLASRLANLSAFQLRLLQHAMAFPSAKRITYSTCSLHKEENEHVVARALLSDIARERGWSVLRRDEQVKGLRTWELRGSEEAVRDVTGNEGVDVADVAEACIRCEKGGEGGTMGFFVAGFVRDESARVANGHKSALEGRRTNGFQDTTDESDEEWEGFSESDS